MVGNVAEAPGTKNEDAEDTDDDEQVDEEEVEKQRLLAQKRCSVKKRTSITGEKTGQAVFAPPYNPKTHTQANQIKAALQRSFMFGSLTTYSLEQVVDAFAGPLVVQSGHEVIRQGSHVDSGDPAFFIIESGRLDVYRRADASAPHPGTKLTTYDQMGQSFGELAILYNCARAATVIAASESVLWWICRDTFNACVKDGYKIMKDRHEKFLSSLDIFKSLTQADRLKIVDVVQLREYNTGDVIIREGADGHEFFLVEQGRVAAVKAGKILTEYGPNDYFGELALLNRQKRAADVVAQTSPTVLAVIDAESFDRVVGSFSGFVAARAKDYGCTAANTVQAVGSGKDCLPPQPAKTCGGFSLERWLPMWCVCSTMEVDRTDRTVV